MRRRIDPRIRLVCVVTLAVLLAISIGIWYAAYRLPTTKQQHVITYSYQQKGSFDYTVYLLPNSLYDTPTLGSGGTYFRKLVDHISAVFSYEFAGDRPAEISGVYQITASVKSKTWEKQFVLVPETPFTSNGQSVSFTVDLPLNLDEYEEIIDAVDKETGVPAQGLQLVIDGNVTTVARTDSGDIQAVSGPSMVIPLRQSPFEVSGELSKQNSGSLGKDEEVYQPSVADRRRYSLIPIPIVGLALLLFISLTESRPAKVDNVRRKRAEARRKYRDRIVEVEALASASDERVVSMGALAELIKVADELGKPVLHLTESDKDIYCVIEGTSRYEYVSRLEETLTPLPPEP